MTKTEMTQPYGANSVDRRPRKAEVDITTLNAGDHLLVETDSSVWHFTPVANRTITEDSIRGMVIQTNSVSFGQYLGSPFDLVHGAMVRVGETMYTINGQGRRTNLTGTVKHIRVNGVEV